MVEKGKRYIREGDIFQVVLSNQLEAEMEGSRRGIYGGAIGYLNFSGNLDVCIAIRIAYAKKARFTPAPEPELWRTVCRKVNTRNA